MAIFSIILLQFVFTSIALWRYWIEKKSVKIPVVVTGSLLESVAERLEAENDAIRDEILREVFLKNLDLKDRV